MAEPSRAELEAAYCWENDDRVPGRPEMTAFRRRVRLHQSRWREAHGHPIGTQPIAPRAGAKARLVGSRLPLDYAVQTGANFVGPAALDAWRARLATKEPHQSLDQQRPWADLLWGSVLAYNLFGDLAADLARADRAVHTWWPDVPGTVREVRFAHSPGWLDPAYTGNLISLDVAIVLDRPDGTSGVVGIATKYHDRRKREVPKPQRLARYREVADRSGVFAPGAVDAVLASDLLVTWLEHLLVLSMVQHEPREWSWARYVVVHAAGNTDYAGASDWYRTQCADPSTFASMTLEDLLASKVLARGTAAALRDRYVTA